MKVLIYRYNSICEPDIIATFREFGFAVEEFTLEMERKDVYPAELVQKVGAFLQEHPVDFVFSVNFYPMLSEVCNIYHIRYVSWVVDAPVVELFSASIRNEWNRTFIFDRALYYEIAALNPTGVFYLPLAARLQDKERLFEKAPSAEKTKFAHEIAFVGSLYSEKCPYDRVKNLPKRIEGYLDGIMRAQMMIYGYYFIEDLLTDNTVAEFKAHFPDFYSDESGFLTDKKVLAQWYMGNKITSMERAETFRCLSERFSVSLYTASDTAALGRVHNMGRAKTLTEMPLIFHESKININTTAKGIRSGLPLRIFDILSCGGFVLSNYQEELPELFEIGEELAVYSSMEELVDLAGYYLEHESERREIAAAGFERLKRDYTYEQQMGKMMLAVFGEEEG